MTYRESAKYLAGDEWTLVDLTGLSVEDLWTCVKTDTTRYDGYDYLARDKCVNFERELWFELGKCMWNKHPSFYQNHMKYVRNDIVKPFKVKQIGYADRVREIQDLANLVELVPDMSWTCPYCPGFGKKYCFHGDTGYDPKC